MKQIAIVLCLQLISTFTFAYCKEISPGVYESSNWMDIPMLIANGASWSGFFYVTNVSDEVITVKTEFSTPDGVSDLPSVAAYGFSFSGLNTPVSEEGAVLMPGEMGFFRIADVPTQHVNVGKISWYSDSCIYKGIIAKILNERTGSSIYSQGQFYFNNGQAF